MASTVKFGKFKHDKAGYAGLMNSGAVQSMLRSKAERVLSAADRGLSEDGYELPGHELKEYRGYLADGYVVRTKTDHARYAQAKRKNLKKSLGYANG